MALFCSKEYQGKLVERIKNKVSQAVTKCLRLKLSAPDGKIREIDATLLVNRKGITALFF